MTNFSPYIEISVLVITCFMLLLRIVSDRKSGRMAELVTMLREEREKNNVKKQTITELYAKLDEKEKHYKQLIEDYKRLEGKVQVFEQVTETQKG